jgi:hypothetical protein
MPVRFSVRVLTSTVTIELDASIPVAVQDRILEQWAHLREPASEDAPIVCVCAPGTDPDTLPSGDWVLAAPESAPDDLATRLTLIGLRGLFGRAVLLHAAGLATADGSVIALIGPSGRGKTTASGVLGRTLRYVTDETVAFDVDGTVIPYPKPLSVGRRPAPKVLHAPAEAGLTVAERPLRIGALVLLEREPDRDGVLVESVPFSDAMAEIAPQSSSLSEIPSVLSSLAELIDRTGGVRRVRYADAEQLPDAVPAILSGRASHVEHVEAVRVADAEHGPGRIGRGDFDDAVTADDRLIVLGRRGLHVLDGLGPAIWLAADGVGPEVLRDRVLSLVESPPADVDADAAIDAAVEELRELGLLEGRGATSAE